MTLDSIHPACFFFAGAIGLALAPSRLRGPIGLLTPLVSLLCLLSFDEGVFFRFELFDYTLTGMRVDRLSLLFGYLFHIAAFIGVVYSLHVKDRVQQVSALMYAGSALIAVFAGDLITLFVAWELLAITSVFLIFARRTDAAIRSGMRYLIWNVLSGVILLAGVLIYSHETGSIAFERIELGGVGTWAIFIAFGIKCGFPLFHTWLTDAYPAATPTGTVFLSAFTTKTAVYALARGFPGTEELIYIGALMTAFPIFYAVIENDLRRVLSYSMINQIGFMVVGIGIGTELALNGAVSHAFNDVIFKGLLFMSMGAVLHVTGKVNGSELGGLYKTMPKTTILCLVGAASISAVPLFSGFVSKSMVMAAALEQGHDWLWLILLFASAGVLEHAGIKIPYFAFFAHDSGIRAKEPPRNMLIAMTISALLCIFIGSYPGYLYSLLPHPVDYVPYTLTHCVTQVQLLCFAGLAVVVLIRSGIYPPEMRSVNLDFEWVYRRLGYRTARFVGGGGLMVYQAFLILPRALLDGCISLLRRHLGPAGLFARTLPIGVSALFAALMLAIFLLVYIL